MRIICWLSVLLSLFPVVGMAGQIQIITPVSGSEVVGSTTFQVHWVSDQTGSVTPHVDATLGTLSFALDPMVGSLFMGDWKKVVDVSSISYGPVTLMVTATDADGSMVNASVVLHKNDPPVLTVTSPSVSTSSDPTLSNLHLVAQCSGTHGRACVSLTAKALPSVSSQTIAPWSASGVSAGSTMELDANYTRLSCGRVDMVFTAVDDLGFRTIQNVSYVLRSPLPSTLVAEVGGSIVDYDANRIVFDDGSGIHLTQLVPSLNQALASVHAARLSSNGVVWPGGEYINGAFRSNSIVDFTHSSVVGDYVLTSSGHSIRQLSTQTTLVIPLQTCNIHGCTDLSSNPLLSVDLGLNGNVIVTFANGFGSQGNLYSYHFGDVGLTFVGSQFDYAFSPQRTEGDGVLVANKQSLGNLYTFSWLEGGTTLPIPGIFPHYPSSMFGAPTVAPVLNQSYAMHNGYAGVLSMNEHLSDYDYSHETYQVVRRDPLGMIDVLTEGYFHSTEVNNISDCGLVLYNRNGTRWVASSTHRQLALDPNVDYRFLGNDLYFTEKQNNGNYQVRRMAIPLVSGTCELDPTSAIDPVNNVFGCSGTSTTVPPDAGIPYFDAGTPFGDAGIPFGDAGIPFGDAGVPFGDAGIPFGDAGIPFDDAGIPFDDAGIPFDDAGIPLGDAGMPVADSGVVPGDDAGLVNPDAGISHDLPFVFLTEPPSHATCEQAYSYVPHVQSTRPTSYLLLKGPSSLAVDATTGELHFTPKANDVGTYTVELSADNGTGRMTQSYALEINCPTVKVQSAGCTSTPANAGWMVMIFTSLMLTRLGRRRSRLPLFSAPNVS